MKIALITLNSGGTMGHYVPLKKLKTSLSKEHELFLVTQDEFSDIKAPFQKTTHSIGGCFIYEEWESLLATLLKNKIEVAIFSTFFDTRLIEELKKSNIKTGLITYPLRDSHAQALINRNSLSNFDEIFIYEDFYKTTIPGKTVSPLIKFSYEPGKNNILITCGGGGLESANKFYKLISETIPKIKKLYPDQKITIIDRLNKYEHVDDNSNVISWSEKLPELILSHKLVISEAGYHTTAELATLGTKAILIPGSRRIDNQELRAVNFSEQGFGEAMFPEEGSDKLIFLIKKVFEKKESKRLTYKSTLIDKEILTWLK